MYFNDVHQYLLEGKRMDPPIHCPEDMWVLVANVINSEDHNEIKK
jgi:hypothetical protein